MTVRIIKSGQRVFRGECAHCGCVFEYESADMRFGLVSCPDCGTSHNHHRARGFPVPHMPNDRPQIWCEVDHSTLQIQHVTCGVDGDAIHRAARRVDGHQAQIDEFHGVT